MIRWEPYPTRIYGDRETLVPSYLKSLVGVAELTDIWDFWQGLIPIMTPSLF